MKHPLPWLPATASFVLFAILTFAPAPADAAPQGGSAPVPATDPAAEPAVDTADDTADDEEAPEETPAATVREEIVVSAQAAEVPRRRVGSSVAVLGREEIEARRATSVAELLRTVPGVEVARTGPPGGNTSVFLRGGNSSHTLVLVDGVRVNSPAVGAYDFSSLSTDDVERIEVVRGPQSALYGSEAMGGVISVHTRRGTRDGLEGGASAEVGTEESRRFATSWRGGGDRADWSFAASHRAFDGVSSASEAAGNDEEDPFSNTTAAGLLGFAFGGDGRGEVSVRYLDSDTGLDGFAFGVGPVDDPNYELDRQAVYANLRFEKPVTDRWTQHLRVGTAREDLAATDPDNPFQAFTTDTVVTDAVLRSDLVLLGDPGGDLGGATIGTTTDTLSLGAGWEERRGEAAGSFDETVEVTSAFAENRFAWRDRLFLTTGVRHDDHSAFGSETTWRGTASWLVGDARNGDARTGGAPGGGIRIHGSYGTGFKAPTFNELYFPGFGNPALAAETSEGWDLGVEFGGSGTTGTNRAWTADVTWFDNDYENLIGFDFTTFRAANISAARARGVESWLSLPLAAGIDTRWSYTWTESEDLATGDPLPRRPEHRASVTALWDPAGAWDASAALVAVADRVDSDGSELDDYQRLDLTAGYAVSDPLTVYLKVDNALDDDSAEIAGYTTPGAVFSVGVRYGL